MTQIFESKRVDVCGYPIYVSGVKSDPYFCHLETHMSANSFLAALMKHHVPANGFFLDVGANIGVTTALAAAIIPNPRIVSIEPSDIAFSCLEKTVQKNNIKAELIKACVGSKSGGHVAFHQMDFLAGSHIIADDHPTIHNAKQTIPVISIDDLVSRIKPSSVDLIKIDVEGFESDVLLGMEKTSKLYSPLVFMEFNVFTITAYRNMSPRALLDQIRSYYGCIFHKVDDRLVKVETDGEFLSLLHNAIVGGGVTDILFTASRERQAQLKSS